MSVLPHLVVPITPEMHTQCLSHLTRSSRRTSFRSVLLILSPAHCTHIADTCWKEYIQYLYHRNSLCPYNWSIWKVHFTRWCLQHTVLSVWTNYFFTFRSQLQPYIFMENFPHLSKGESYFLFILFVFFMVFITIYHYILSFLNLFIC